MASPQFGDLRALLQQQKSVGEWYWPERDWFRSEQSEAWWQREKRWRVQLQELLLTLHQDDPVHYEEVCLPYLAQFESLWRYPLAEMWHNAYIESPPWSYKLRDIVPAQAKFAFHAFSNALNGSIFRNRAKNVRLSGLLHGFVCANLSDHAVMSEGAENLAELADIAHLEQLILSGCFVRDEGLCALGRSPYLQRLEVLDVSRCELGDRGIERLAETFQLKSLRVLGLSRNHLTTRSLEVLMCSPTFDALELLDVRDNALGEDVTPLIERWSARRGRPLDVRLT